VHAVEALLLYVVDGGRAASVVDAWRQRWLADAGELLKVVGR
jgi:hypothetical protein